MVSISTLKVYYKVCYVSDESRSSLRTIVQTIFTCSPWVTIFTVPVIFLFGYIIILSVRIFYQVYTTKFSLKLLKRWTKILITNKNIWKVFYLGLTMNEKKNLKRYKHFLDDKGKLHNPYRLEIFWINWIMYCRPLYFCFIIFVKALA